MGALGLLAEAKETQWLAWEKRWEWSTGEAAAVERDTRVLPRLCRRLRALSRPPESFNACVDVPRAIAIAHLDRAGLVACDRFCALNVPGNRWSR